MILKPMIGAVVRLKAGGPLMTLNKLEGPIDSIAERAECIWFDGTKLKRATFPCDCLEFAQAVP